MRMRRMPLSARQNNGNSKKVPTPTKYLNALHCVPLRGATAAT